MLYNIVKCNYILVLGSSSLLILKKDSDRSILEIHIKQNQEYMIQNPFLTAQSTQIKSVISVPIKDFIHHYPRALFNDIPRVGAHFYDIPGSGRTFTTYPGRGAV